MEVAFAKGGQGRSRCHLPDLAGSFHHLGQEARTLDGLVQSLPGDPK